MGYVGYTAKLALRLGIDKMQSVSVGPVFPHGEIFGYEHVDHEAKAKYVWLCRFEAKDGMWLCHFLDIDLDDSQLFGAGLTPRDAFEHLVAQWLALDGHTGRSRLELFLPHLRAELDAYGLVSSDAPARKAKQNDTEKSP